MPYSSAIIIDDLWDDKLLYGIYSEFTVIFKYHQKEYISNKIKKCVYEKV